MDEPRLILVVEDDEATRAFLLENLAADGFRVAGASSAGEGVRGIEVRRPHLVVLDLALEGGSGLDLLDRVRHADGLASRIDPDLPVIVLSGRVAEADRVRSFARGADDHVLQAVVSIVCVVGEPHSGLGAPSCREGGAAARPNLRDDLELVVSEALPEPEPYLGRDAAAAWFGKYFRSFEPGYTFRMEEIIEVAGDVVVIAAHHGIGRRSGVEISGESAYLYGVEGEKIARVALYRDRREAPEAVRVRE